MLIDSQCTPQPPSPLIGYSAPFDLNIPFPYAKVRKGNIV